MRKLLPYIILIVVGLALLFAPLVYKSLFAVKVAPIAKALVAAKATVTLDMILDYAQKIVGLVISIIGIVQATRTVHYTRKRKAK
jgi:hypothetical protein